MAKNKKAEEVLKYQVFSFRKNSMIRVNVVDYLDIDRAKEMIQKHCMDQANMRNRNIMRQYIIVCVPEVDDEYIVDVVTEVAQPRTNRCDR